MEIFLSFVSGLVEEFEVIFKDFLAIEKLSQFLQTPYDVLPDEKLTDVVNKLFKISKAKF